MIKALVKQASQLKENDVFVTQVKADSDTLIPINATGEYQLYTAGALGVSVIRKLVTRVQLLSKSNKVLVEYDNITIGGSDVEIFGSDVAVDVIYDVSPTEDVVNSPDDKPQEQPEKSDDKPKRKSKTLKG